MTHTADPEALISALSRKLSRLGYALACAESCTGGLVSHLLTNRPGSSAWFKGAVVAYSNDVKMKVLGVARDILDEHGAVSEQTVLAMAAGTRRLLETRAGLAISGIAGPDGGSPDKPVGTVWIAWDLAGQLTARRFLFAGQRLEIKAQSALAALEGLDKLLD